MALKCSKFWYDIYYHCFILWPVLKPFKHLVITKEIQIVSSRVRYSDIGNLWKENDHDIASVCDNNSGVVFWWLMYKTVVTPWSYRSLVPSHRLASKIVSLVFSIAEFLMYAEQVTALGPTSMFTLIGDSLEQFVDLVLKDIDTTFQNTERYERKGKSQHNHIAGPL